MGASELLEKWNAKCETAREAEELYSQDPTPENLAALQKANYERGLIEEEMDPGASHSHRP